MSSHPNPAAVKAAQQFVGDVRARVGQVVVGQDIVVERVMIALLTGGHLLLQGMPGLAKTRPPSSADSLMPYRNTPARRPAFR